MLKTPPAPLDSLGSPHIDDAPPCFELIASVREQIEAGLYETPEKIATLINRLSAEMNRSDW